jgi:hypothetical protein
MPQPGHGEDPFKVEHDETEEEQQKDRDREVADIPDPGGFRAQIAAQSVEANRLATAVDVKSNAAETHNKLTSDPPKVPDVAVSDPTPSADLNKKTDALKQASEKLGESEQKDTEWTVSSYLVAIGSVVATGVGVYSLIQYLSRKALEKPTDDIPALDPKTKAVLDQLSSDWKTISDKDYWERLATYIEKHAGKLSLGDQLVFMNLTVMLGGYSNGFLWDTTQDQSDYADRLVKVYQEKNSSPAMIRAAADMTYGGQPIPRVVAADLLRLALAWIGVQPSGKVPT